MSTYSITAGGPCTALAHLRQLWSKAAATTRARGRSGRPAAVRLAARSAVELLSSDTGYHAAVALLRSAAGAAWRLTGAALTALGRATAAAARPVGRAAALLGRPAAAARLQRAAGTAAKAVRRSWVRIDATVCSMGAVLAGLLLTAPVRRTATTAARTAALLLWVHAVSDGAVAARIVTAVPASMDAVVAATDPATLLGIVAALTAAAALIALLQMLVRPDRRPDDHPGAPQQQAARHPSVDNDGQPIRAVPDAPAPPPASPPPVPVGLPVAAEAVRGLELAAAHLRIEVTGDGSVVVHGIPGALPPALGQVVAGIAGAAVERHLQRILLVRPEPTRSDRRLLTKAAREAITAEARRRQRAALDAVA